MASVLSTNLINSQLERAALSGHSTCQRCQDTGWKRIIQGPISSVRRCTAAVHLRDSLIAANVPQTYTKCSLEEFAVPSSSIGLLERINQFCGAYPKVSEGFFFTGGSNTGKTHLAVAIMAELMGRGARRLRFYETSDLLRRLDPESGVLGSRQRRELQHEAQSTGLVVLDDFGAESLTGSEIEQLDYLIDCHYRATRPMIVTSRLSSSELSSIFKPRLISRMMSMVTEISLD
jgi:DNA replication protein DnaC